MNEPQGKKVIVGMSGGVDSSVTALLLKQQGYDVHGIFMKNWDEDDGTEYCTAKDDFLDAAIVAEQIGIELDAVNFAGEYWDRVFEHFLQEYRSGRTPNPDILCNKEIKFKAFLDYALELGADYIATGHYARTTWLDGRCYLQKGADNNKDQSYFLHAVSEKEFAKTLFPLGDIEKSKVREIAKEFKLKTHDKKDSTGICFIGERKFKDFLQRYIPAQPGNIVTKDGDIVGQHSGLMYYTIGQRQGLGIGGNNKYKQEPWYVVSKELDSKELVVAQGNDDELYTRIALLEDMHWVTTERQDGARLHAKVRYRQSDQACTLQDIDGVLCAVFDEPQRAITPGQYCVFYEGELCLGGAVIASVKN